MKKRILVVGGSGLLGHKILEKKNSRFEMYGTYFSNPFSMENVEIIKLNISDKKSCKKISEFKPDIIINTTALTNVDFCEKFKEEAFNVNVLGTRNLAKIANQIGSKFIHISTDNVFSGKKRKYSENDIQEPINVYGQTKLKSETEAALVSDYTVLRTCVLFGIVPFNLTKNRSDSIKPMNFAMWVLTKMANNELLRIVKDQINTPTLADNLADVIIKISNKKLSGIFHASGLTCISRYEFTKKIAKIFRFSDKNIIPIVTKDLNQFALRPLQTCLNCDKIIKEGINLLDLDESIEIMYNQIKKCDLGFFQNSEHF